MTAAKAIKDLHALADAERARNLQWFFKTGPGEYAEGDLFLGIRVPATRRVAKRYADLPLDQVFELLHSEFHEQRLLALLILVRQFERGDEPVRKTVFDGYIANMQWINNWDLVDASAERIVGGYLRSRDRSLLQELTASDVLWERRIAVVATLAFIKAGDFDDILALASKLLGDREDLIHKAVGWMLREMGKRDMTALDSFIEEHHERMPRTMLRYAIEHYPEEKRSRYVNSRKPRPSPETDGNRDLPDEGGQS